MSARRVAVLLAAFALAACASRPPAPVVDRSPPPRPAAPAASAPAAKPETRADDRVDTHVVKRGDTLYSIALDHGMDWRELASLNGITDPGRLQVGQTLRLRTVQAASAGGVEVMPIGGAAGPQARALGGDAPAAPAAATPGAAASAAPPAAPSSALRTEPKAVKLPYSEENLAAVSRPEPARAAAKPEAPPAAAKPDAPPVAVATLPKPAVEPAKPQPEPARPRNENLEDGVEWSWPVSGKLIAGFSDSSKGLQFSGRMGDPVHATAAGEVVYVGTGIRGLGKLVVIRHSEKYLSVYGHNRDIVVKERQKVVLGQKIAEIGNTDADQPKLHFEIRRFGKPVDPMQFLPGRP